MTENVNPKPFNVSRLKCQRYNKLERKLEFINQSIKRCVYGQLAEQNSNQRL